MQIVYTPSVRAGVRRFERVSKVTVDGLPEEAMQERIGELEDLIRAYHAKPRVEAIVSDIVRRTPRFSDFSKGQMVVYSEEFRGQKKGTQGRIDELASDGLALVRFTATGDSHKLRCGHPAVDGGISDITPLTPVRDIVMSLDNRLFHVSLPSKMELKPGEVIVVDMQSMQIVSKSDKLVAGKTATISRLLDKQAEVVMGNDLLLVNCYVEAEEGDRVVIDSLGTVVLRSLGREDPVFIAVKDTGVHWSDIGGHEEAKRVLHNSVIGPIEQPDLYSKFNVQAVRGILLYGPPGCGKTMLGKALATEVSKIGGSPGTTENFVYIKGPEILVKWVGDSEAKLRSLFSSARRKFEKTGIRQVLFFDEGDSVLYRRGTGRSSDVERTIVATFLSEMDGMDSNGAIVIIATNKPDSLDEAVTRPGRIDRAIRVGRPSIDESAQLFKLYLDRAPIDESTSSEGLSQIGAGSLFNKGRILCNVAMRNPEDSFKFTFGHIASGALISTIVESTKTNAMDRARAGGSFGVIVSDLKAAIDTIFESNKGLDHTDAIKDFLGPKASDITTMERVNSVA